MEKQNNMKIESSEEKRLDEIIQNKAKEAEDLYNKITEDETDAREQKILEDQFLSNHNKSTETIKGNNHQENLQGGKQKEPESYEEYLKLKENKKDPESEKLIDDIFEYDKKNTRGKNPNENELASNEKDESSNSTNNTGDTKKLDLRKTLKGLKINRSFTKKIESVTKQKIEKIEEGKTEEGKTEEGKTEEGIKFPENNTEVTDENPENKTEVTDENPENKTEVTDENPENKKYNKELMEKLDSIEKNRAEKLEGNSIKGKVIKTMDAWENFGKEKGMKGFAKRMAKNAVNLALVGMISSFSVEKMAEAGIGTATALGGGVFSYVATKMATGLGMMGLVEGVSKSLKNEKTKKALSWTIGIAGVALSACTGAGVAVGAASAAGLIASKFIKNRFTSEKIKEREDAAKEKFSEKHKALFENNNKDVDFELKLIETEREYENLLKKYENQRIWGRIVDGATKLTISSVVSAVSLEAVGAMKDIPHTENNLSNVERGNIGEVKDIPKESGTDSQDANVPNPENTPPDAESGNIGEVKDTTGGDSISDSKIEAVSDRGQGSISTIRELQEKIKGEYSNSDNIPENIKHILETDPHKLAKEFGMYDPNQENESALIHEGDKFVLDKETGSLIFDKENGEDVNLSSGQKFEGQMMDTNKNEYTNTETEQNSDSTQGEGSPEKDLNPQKDTDPKTNNERPNVLTEDGKIKIERTDDQIKKEDNLTTNDNKTENEDTGNKQGPQNETSNNQNEQIETKPANDIEARLAINPREIKNLPEDQLNKLIEEGVIVKKQGGLFGLFTRYEIQGGDRVMDLHEKAENLGLNAEPQNGENINDYEKRLSAEISNKEKQIIINQETQTESLSSKTEKEFKAKYQSDDTTHRVVEKFTSKDPNFSLSTARKIAEDRLRDLNNGKTDWIDSEKIKEITTIKNANGSFTTIVAAEAKKIK